MSDQPKNLDSLFEAALAIDSPEGRAAFLDESCSGDAELRSRIDRLLVSHQQAESFLENPAPGLEETMVVDVSGRNPVASLDAGLAPALGEEAAVVIGDANHRVLKMLGNTLSEVPSVLLRESEVEGSDPITRPNSPEMPKSDSGSRYRLDGEIARGGMGAIIKGRDTDLGRDLAIKVLLDSHKDKPEVIQRFVEEAQIGGQLQHPGIAPVYELGQFSDKRPFFAMKLVKGQTLSKLLDDREDAGEDRARFLGIFEQVCQTMGYAHSRGVIHRDLKPANIMVGAFGEVQVMDWGLAKVIPAGGVADERQAHNQQQGQSVIQTLRSGVGSDAPAALGSVGSETQMGSVMGTPAYMPPEQALGEIDHMDERADVFGLGAILCEILTGKPPYVADDGTRVFRMASRGKLDDCFGRLDASGVDADLIAIAKHCLEMEPGDRPRDAAALSEKITDYLESVEARLRETERQRAAEAARAEESRKRARVTMALAATVLLALSLGGGGWMILQQQAARHLAAATSIVNDRLGNARLHHGLATAVDVSNVEGQKERIRELGVALESVRDAINLTEADDIPPALRNSSGELLATIETELTSAQQAAEQAAANRALELELQLIRLSRDGGGETAPGRETLAFGDAELVPWPIEEETERLSSNERYRNAFLQAGLDLTTSSREDAVDWIRNSPIRETLIAALDDWSRDEASRAGGIPSELASISWTLLEPREGKSTAATLNLLPDGSILAGPATPEDDHYTIVVQPEEGSISALRLEMLTDESIPGGGLSHHKTGNFKLQEIRAFVSADGGSLRPIPFADAVASYSWWDRSISRAIDGNVNTEWHVWAQSRQPQQAIFLFGAPANVTKGQTLVIELHQNHTQPLGRFRLSGATDLNELRTWRKTSRKELRDLANAADHSEWRKRLRSTLAANDVEKLMAMATDEETSRQSPEMIAWLGASLRSNSWHIPSAADLSVKILDDARNRYPSDFWLNYELGASLDTRSSRRERDAGIGYLRTAMALRPQSLVTLLALRNALDRQERHDEWIELTRRIIQLDPVNKAQNRARLGVALMAQDKLNDAIAEFRKAIELGPMIAGVHQYLGEALYRNLVLGLAKEECQRVIALYDELITDKTRDGEWFANRAMACLALQQWESAKVDWLRAIELDPKLLQRVFESCRQAGRQSDAMEVGLQHIEAKPDNELRWMKVAPVLVLAGQRKGYAAFCERAVEQFSDITNPEVSERITKSMLLLPDAIEPDKLPAQQFIDSLENGTATAGQQPWFWTTRALLAYRTGDAESAVQYATCSEEHKPSEVTRTLTHAVLALAQHKLGNTAAATTALRQATQLVEKLEQNTTGYDADLQIANVLNREAEAKIHGKGEGE